MKTKFLKFFCMAASVALFSGCQSDSSKSNLVIKKTPVLVREAQTNFVPLLTTNWVEHSSTQTNATTGEIITRGVIIPEVTTNIQPVVLPAIYYTNLALTSLASNAVQTAGTAAAVAGIPFANTIAYGALALSTFVFGFLNNRNKKRAEDEAAGRAQTETALETAMLVGKTAVQTAEEFRKAALTVPGYTRDMDDKVVTIVQKLQDAAGVKSQIAKLVEDHTEFTHPGK